MTEYWIIFLAWSVENSKRQMSQSGKAYKLSRSSIKWHCRKSREAFVACQRANSFLYNLNFGYAHSFPVWSGKAFLAGERKFSFLVPLISHGMISKDENWCSESAKKGNCAIFCTTQSYQIDSTLKVQMKRILLEYTTQTQKTERGVKRVVKICTCSLSRFGGGEK